MKTYFLKQIKNSSSLLSRAILGMLLLCGSAYANTVFHVNVDTSSLIGNSSGPFALDFQFNNGSVLGNNSAVVNNFTYGGGGAVGIATSINGALGDISSSVLFNNSAAFQELYQTFTAGTKVGFDVNLTTNVDGATPDIFTFAILDKDSFNIPATGLGDSLLLVNLSGATPVVQTFTGKDGFSGVTVKTPESGSCLLLLTAAPLFVFAVRKKQHGA